MRLFAVATPGLEAVLGREVAALAGAHDVRVVTGGVEFEGDEDVLARAHLELATATRVLVRAGEVRAREFAALRRGVARLAWERFAAAPPAVEVDATARRCRLYHTGAIAERVAGGVADRLGAPAEAAKAAEEAGPTLHLVVRGEDDVFTVSVDASGEPLYRRGARVETGRAPLRETLAAGLLALCGWDGETPLWDPMCGAGTILVEAARTALRQPPGAGRAFAFQAWPGFREEAWRRLVGASLAAARSTLPAPVGGSDRDAAAIDVARRNLERAGLGAHVTLARADAAAAPLPGAPGLLLCNLPYGKRIPAAAVRGAVAALGRLARRAPAWRLGALAAAATDVPAAIGRRAEAVHALVNGGVRVRLYVFAAAR